MPATGPQYDLGSKLTWLVQAQVLRATAGCMATSGYHISDRPAPFNLAMFADNTQMPDLPRIARTHEFVGPGDVTSASYPKAEQNVFNTCHAKTAAPYQQLLAAGQALDDSWWKVVFRIQASSQVHAAIPALAACAARYGFPNGPYGNASGPVRSFADFMDWVAGFLDGAGSRGAPASTLQPSPGTGRESSSPAPVRSSGCGSGCSWQRSRASSASMRARCSGSTSWPGSCWAASLTSGLMRVSL